MTGLRLTTGIRLALAFVISLLIHAALLLTPPLKTTLEPLPIPPLTARLQPIPQPGIVAETQSDAVGPVTTAPQMTPAATEQHALMPLAKSDIVAQTSPLPDHLQLDYAVYSGSDLLKSAEVRYYVDINQNHYVIRSVENRTGITGALNRNQSIFTSLGQIGPSGFLPTSLESRDSHATKKHRQQARFDRVAGTLRLFDGSETQLPAGAQDIVSFRFQLSLIPMRGELFELPVSDGERLETYRIEIRSVEELDTPMGTLHGLRLRQLHARNEAYFEIWLSQEYRLLPVKFIQFDPSENVAETWEVTEIRASED